ncbi:MAG: rhodanese-like domain-containing protein [Acidiferrobacterales bacterium]|nr:rhodanese-like domain-containing protein [Acidiferrobacterales bacterium]
MEYIEFVKINWHLFVALVAVVALLAFEPLRKRTAGVASVLPHDLPRIMKKEKVIIVDVSDTKEFETGRIPKARNIPLSRIESDINTLTKFRSRPIVVVCRIGNRSGKAASMLKKHDFSDVRTLKGGFTAWAKENLPVEK